MTLQSFIQFHTNPIPHTSSPPPHYLHHHHHSSKLHYFKRTNKENKQRIMHIYIYPVYYYTISPPYTHSDTCALQQIDPFFPSTSQTTFSFVKKMPFVCITHYSIFFLIYFIYIYINSKGF